MEAEIKSLKKIIRDVKTTLKGMTDEEWNAARGKGKWTKKEILGHLVDSAQNNVRRFVVTQYQLDIPHIIYDQDKWVALQNYKNYPSRDLIELWLLINRHFIRILETMPQENYDKMCNTGKIFSEPHALSWLAEDYIVHLKHHLGQIIS